MLLDECRLVLATAVDQKLTDRGFVIIGVKV